MKQAALCLLPGSTRQQDIVVPRDSIQVDKADSDGRCIVTFSDETLRAYPFVMPCSFRLEWNTLEAAANYMQLRLAVGGTIKDTDKLSRTPSSGLIALTDGSVHMAKRTMQTNDPVASKFSGILITYRLPAVVDMEWVYSQLERAAVSSFMPDIGSIR